MSRVFSEDWFLAPFGDGRAWKNCPTSTKFKLASEHTLDNIWSSDSFSNFCSQPCNEFPCRSSLACISAIGSWTRISWSIWSNATNFPGAPWSSGDYLMDSATAPYRLSWLIEMTILVNSWTSSSLAVKCVVVLSFSIVLAPKHWYSRILGDKIFGKYALFSPHSDPNIRLVCYCSIMRRTTSFLNQVHLVQIDRVKQPIQSNSVGPRNMSHVGSSTFDDHHSDCCLIVFKHTQHGTSTKMYWVGWNVKPHTLFFSCTLHMCSHHISARSVSVHISLHPHAIHDVTCLIVWCLFVFVVLLCISHFYLFSLTVYLFSFLHNFHNVVTAEGKTTALTHNEEYCPVAIYNPLTGYEPNKFDDFDYSKTSALIFQDESGDRDTEPRTRAMRNSTMRLSESALFTNVHSGARRTSECETSFSLSWRKFLTTSVPFRTQVRGDPYTNLGRARNQNQFEKWRTNESGFCLKDRSAPRSISTKFKPILIEVSRNWMELLSLSEGKLIILLQVMNNSDEINYYFKNNCENKIGIFVKLVSKVFMRWRIEESSRVTNRRVSKKKIDRKSGHY